MQSQLILAVFPLVRTVSHAHNDESLLVSFLFNIAGTSEVLSESPSLDVFTPVRQP